MNKWSGKALMEDSDNQLKVGLFGIGLDTYWPQFPGLRDRLAGFTAQVARKLESSRVKVVNLGLVDTPEKSFAAGHEFRKADVDLIFLYVTTYALSSTVLPAVRRAKVPVIILNLSPAPAIEYDNFNRLADRTKMTGEWLAYCQACPVPEIANVFNRCRIPFFQVSGVLENDPVAWDEIGEWIEAARVAHIMEHNRLGVMGNYYGGMLDIYSDLTQQCGYFGDLAFASHEARGRPRQVRVRDRSQGREALRAELEDPDGLGEVLQPVLAEVKEQTVTWIELVSRRLREEHLVAVPARRDASPKVNVLADIALAGEVRHPRVDPDADADRSFGEQLDALLGSCKRSGSRREREEEGIALRIDLDTAVGSERLAQDRAMLLEFLGVPLRPELVQQLRRAFDVCEEKGDGSRRKTSLHATK